MTEIIGTIAALLTTFSSVPQIIKVHKTNHTKDLSLSYFLIMWFGIFLWLIYGILINDYIIVTANIVTISFISYLVYKIYFNLKLS